MLAVAGSTVIAVAAIVASAVVGLLGVVVPAVSGSRRQARELKAERAREVRLARRQVLEDGAVLLRELMGAIAHVEPAGPPGHVDPRTTDKLQEVGPRISAVGARLPLWFERDSQVIAAWDTAVAVIGARMAAPESESLKARIQPALDDYADAVREYVGAE